MSRPRFWRTALLGVRSLRLHKLPSALSVLGIMLGVLSLTSLLSMGEGPRHEAELHINSLGSENIVIKSKKPSEKSGPDQEQTEVTAYGLTHEDLARMESTLPSLKTLVPVRLISIHAYFRQQTLEAQLVATTPEYSLTGNLRLARGRWIAHNDLEAQRPICVLGASVASSLFLADDPIGSDVKLDAFYFRVVGVLEAIGVATGTGGGEAKGQNFDVYVPLTTALKRYGDSTVRTVSGSQMREKVEFHQIICSLESDRAVTQSAHTVRSLLGRFHPEQDYEVLVPLELLEQKERSRKTFKIVLGSIAAISLLVSGVGIMSIMLASILERTREIGVRRALGAKRGDILLQFLVESVSLSTLGGLLSVLLEPLVPHAVEVASGMKMVVTPWSIVVSLGTSTAVGIIFGLYPARRAADMDPIVGLKRE